MTAVRYDKCPKCNSEDIHYNIIKDYHFCVDCKWQEYLCNCSASVATQKDNIIHFPRRIK